MSRTYYVYMMASNSKVIYTGMTNDLEKRVFQHKGKLIPGFSNKYNTYKLVWFDETDDVVTAIEYEKKIKGWLRNKKIALIEETNLNWNDISKDWFK